MILILVVTDFSENLPEEADYFPLQSGKYEIKPGLSAFGTDFGNAEQDRKLFQLDCHFDRYRQARLASRSERLDKYVQTDGLFEQIRPVVTRFIARRLHEEYPQWFELQPEEEYAYRLHCRLTDEILKIDARGNLVESTARVSPAYESGIDALICQVQEDISVVQIDDSGQDRLTFLHLCYPNHWAAEAKIGRHFVDVHQPVAGFDKMSQQHKALVNTMLQKGPFVRFAWGLATDTRLNHHPHAPADIDLDEWQGRRFDPANPELYLRVERQVIWSLPDINAALFTIRTRFIDCEAVKQNDERSRLLQSALQSMSAESLQYKGLERDRDAILDWLQQ